MRGRERYKIKPTAPIADALRHDASRRSGRAIHVPMCGSKGMLNV